LKKKRPEGVDNRKELSAREDSEAANCTINQRCGNECRHMPSNGGGRNRVPGKENKPPDNWKRRK